MNRAEDSISEKEVEARAGNSAEYARGLLDAAKRITSEANLHWAYHERRRNPEQTEFWQWSAEFFDEASQRLRAIARRADDEREQERRRDE